MGGLSIIISPTCSAVTQQKYSAVARIDSAEILDTLACYFYSRGQEMPRTNKNQHSRCCAETYSSSSSRRRAPNAQDLTKHRTERTLIPTNSNSNRGSEGCPLGDSTTLLHTRIFSEEASILFADSFEGLEELRSPAPCAP